MGDMFVSLRGALAYALIAQAWLQVYVVATQRIQKPTNIDCRRLNTITRKAQSDPQSIRYPHIRCAKAIDVHTETGYRRLTGDAEDETKGYGMRGVCVLRRGMDCGGGRGQVHLLDSVCKSHRLQVRSSYGAEILAAAHGLEDAFITLVTLHELANNRRLTPTQLKGIRETGGLCIHVTLTTDAENVYKSLTSWDLKTPTEKTLLGHVAWVRELLGAGVIKTIQWCDTRDMSADGHTKGAIPRDLLIQVMGGSFTYKYDTKKYTPTTTTPKSSATTDNTPHPDDYYHECHQTYDDQYYTTQHDYNHDTTTTQYYEYDPAQWQWQQQ